MALCRLLCHFELVVPSVGFGHLELYCLPGLLDAIMLARGEWFELGVAYE